MKKRNKIITIAIDSPAAAGAGTQSKLIAKEYNLLYLDTGKIYRYIGKLKLESKIFNYKVVKEKINRRNGIHAFFGRQWPNSVGHGVWNDIFAVFHSLVRFGYENSKFPPVVIDPKDSPCCRNEIDFRDFSGNKLEFLKDRTLKRSLSITVL